MVLRVGETRCAALMCLCFLSGLCGCPDKESRRHDEPHELGVCHSREERGKALLACPSPVSAPRALVPSPWQGAVRWEGTRVG